MPSCPDTSLPLRILSTFTSEHPPQPRSILQTLTYSHREITQRIVHLPIVPTRFVAVESRLPDADVFFCACPTLTIVHKVDRSICASRFVEFHSTGICDWERTRLLAQTANLGIRSLWVRTFPSIEAV